MNGAGQAGTGLGADYEYEIISYKNDQFLLKGRKNKMEATLTKATNEEREAIKNGALMENQDQAPIKKNTSLSVIKDKRMILYLMVEKQVSYPLTMEIRPYK